MQGQQLLQKILQRSLPSIHKARLDTLFHAVTATLEYKQLSLTTLGRNLGGNVSERSNIQKMNRLLKNPKLHAEMNGIYKVLARELCGKTSSPVILLDWACQDKRKDFFILRACLAAKGRGLTLFQKAYSKKFQNSPVAQNNFLQELKEILPAGATPIIVTDAGFGVKFSNQ